MAMQVVRRGGVPDEFARLHRLFVHHFAFALGFVWLASLVAATYAPWTRNLRGLIDPAGRAESTLSYLFGLPLLMTAAWLCVALGGETLRRSRLLKSEATEFAFAGAVAFVVFCLAIDRAVTALRLAV